MTRFGPISEGGAATPRDRSYWVVDGRLIAGAYPFSDDVATGARVLQKVIDDGGVTAFVDLTGAGMPPYSDAHLMPYGEHLVEEVRTVRCPIPDMGVPTTDEMAEILDTIDGLLDAGETVYVHCWGGLGRTGTVVACWLLRHDAADHDDVIEVLTELRRADRGAGHHEAPQARSQYRFIRDWPIGG